jgi:hypothetical protein
MNGDDEIRQSVLSDHILSIRLLYSATEQDLGLFCSASMELNKNALMFKNYSTKKGE